jgi:uncharacterized membrane protein YeaQ/YmgE (transglycosylase-associated protein family)
MRIEETISQERSMTMLWMIIVGLIVGALAKLVMPGRDPGGFIITILLGIVGSMIAGSIAGLSAGTRKASPQGLSRRFSARCCCCFSIGC